MKAETVNQNAKVLALQHMMLKSNWAGTYIRVLVDARRAKKMEPSTDTQLKKSVLIFLNNGISLKNSLSLKALIKRRKKKQEMLRYIRKMMLISKREGSDKMVRFYASSLVLEKYESYRPKNTAKRYPDARP